ncbi:MAG: Gfo/Idh/MocA family protein [bacterium]
MRWGIIGFGRISRNRFLPALEEVEGSELTAIVTTHPENIKDIPARYSPKIYSDVNELDDVDVVYIATPNSMHKDQAITCARKGINVFCEKPIALNVIETVEMIEECQRNRVVLGVAHMGRFNPFNIGAKRLLEDNIVGRLGIIKASFSFVNDRRDEWRYNPLLSGGGSIMDIGVHIINAIHYFRPGKRIVEVCAINENLGYEVEQNAAAIARFDDGVIALMDASYDTSSSVSFEIRGDKGILYILDTLFQEYDGKVILRMGNEFKFYTFYGRNQYLSEILDMEEAISKGKKPATDGYDALKDMEVIEAWYRSNRNRKREDLSSLLTL